MESVVIDPLTEFYDSIGNPLTKDRYEKRLGLFFKFLKLEGSLKDQARTFTTQAKHDNLWATYQINEYMRTQKLRAEKKEISESTIPNFYKPIKLFCEENDIILNWKKISRRIPKGRKYANDRAPTREEILAILSYHDPRIKPIVLTMVSAGFRVGAWDYLKVKHLEPIEKKGIVIAGKLTVYPGDNEEYTAFITPEAYRALKVWLDSRIQAGEKVTKESWLMRDLWDDSKYKNMKIARRGFVSAPKKLTSTGVRRLIERALVTQGVRKQKLEKCQRRYEFQADHGFRKYFDSVCDKRMKTLYVEFLLGHNTGLKESYNREQEAGLLSEYLKAVPDLTFLETIQVSTEDVETLKKTQSELALILTKAEKAFKIYEKDAQEKDREIEDLKKRLAKLEQSS